MHLPDDENGDVLRRMMEKGDDLTRPRDIDFSVLFADENQLKSLQNIFVQWHEVIGGERLPGATFSLGRTVVRRMPPCTRGSPRLKTCCNPSRTVGEGVTTGGDVSIDRLETIPQTNRCATFLARKIFQITPTVRLPCKCSSEPLVF